MKFLFLLFLFSCSTIERPNQEITELTNEYEDEDFELILKDQKVEIICTREPASNKKVCIPK